MSMKNLEQIANLLRALADIIDDDSSDEEDLEEEEDEDEEDEEEPVAQSNNAIPAPVFAAESKPKRKPRKVVHPCCGSKGRLHKKSCPSLPPPEENSETKEFRCENCMWKFETSDLDDVKCIECGSSDVWPVTS